jgi:uncharacterized protein YdeI (YjbR/CyaY-like superfamily)
VSETRDGLPVLAFASQHEWERWLEENHETVTGVWLKLAKARSGARTVSYAEALEGALCYGWIDGQRASHDDRFTLQRYTPRRPRSKWSRVNRDRATELEREGRLRPAGLAQVELARQDGRWDAAYEPQTTATVPDDLQRELDANPVAREGFAALDSRNRYAILYRLMDAKRPETRARRIAQFVAMLNEGRTLY